MEIKTIEEPKKEQFDEEVNNLLSDGFRVLSTNSFFGGSHENGWVESYSAILIREIVPVGKETCTLTLPKDEMGMLLFDMCAACKSKDTYLGCDFCIFYKLFPEFEKSCPFMDEDDPGEYSLYIDMAVSRGLLKWGVV